MFQRSLYLPLATLAVCGALLNTALAGGPSFNLRAPQLPDPKLTPGDTLDVTAKDICVSGYAGKVRNVPQSVKAQAYKLYGIARREKGEYEVDHLISLQLGGSNSLRNLWPESFMTKPWNAHVKDQLENKLHDEICKNQINIKAAQQEIATDWIAAYKKHFKTETPLADKTVSKGRRRRSKSPVNAEDEADVITADKGWIYRLFHPRSKTTTRASAAPVSSPNGKVWVNTSSKVYWQPGTQYYGKTKAGKYMTEADAIKAGYHAAKGQ